MWSDSHSKLQAGVSEGGWTESSVDDCLIRGGPGLVACTATALVTPLMLGCYEQLGPGPRRIGWGHGQGYRRHEDRRRRRQAAQAASSAPARGGAHHRPAAGGARAAQSPGALSLALRLASPPLLT